MLFEQSLNVNASIDLERLPLCLVIHLPTYKGTRVNTEATEMSAIYQALQKLLQISSPPQGVKVLLQNPELLTDQADNLLVMLIDNAKAQQRESFVKVLTGLRSLAQEVRQQREQKERLEEIL